MKSIVSILVLISAFAPVSLSAQENARVEELEKSQRAYIDGEYHLALAIISRLMMENADDADLLRRYASIEAALGNFAAAQISIDRAKDIAPHDGDILLTRANILYWQGNYHQAQLQASELGELAPDYPGLRPLQSALRKALQADVMALRTLSLGSSLSTAKFSTGASQQWLTQYTAVSFGSETSIVSLLVEREERLQTDTRLSGRLDIASGENWLHVSGSLTPKPDFRESWSVDAGADVAASSTYRLLVDGRFAKYSTDDVVTMGLGVRREFGRELHITVRSLHLFGGGEKYRLGAALRGDYHPNETTSSFVTLASYPDAEIDGTRTLRSVAAGVAWQPTDRVRLGASGVYEVRERSYKRSSLALDLRWTLGSG